MCAFEAGVLVERECGNTHTHICMKVMCNNVIHTTQSEILIIIIKHGRVDR